jgi:hypothetical protein
VTAGATTPSQEKATVRCPLCRSGVVAYLGQLGSLVHGRCVDCGATMHTDIADLIDAERADPRSPWADDDDEPHPLDVPTTDPSQLHLPL